ncbi:glycerol-3-phosphate acyltransferase [Spiroplasma clarkii]|uniref:glycerol-3-phosphate acyltransferase n=1 Tax=Spiroplasma clarkii TaxID=2139 RepID=UPI001C9900C1|nr:glycerol-3-phosphate acyltransferase [Spiroplasma clarkii]
MRIGNNVYGCRKNSAHSFNCILISLIPHQAFNQTSYFIPCLFTLIGHCYPIYYKFRGGKAVSCLIGLLFVTNWILFLAFTLVWFSLIFIFRRVSVSSIFGAIVVMILIWLPPLSLLTFADLNSKTYFDYNGFEFFTTLKSTANWEIAMPFNALHKIPNKSSNANFLIVSL